MIQGSHICAVGNAKGDEERDALYLDTTARMRPTFEAPSNLVAVHSPT